jgi:hypothetical protein
MKRYLTSFAFAAALVWSAAPPAHSGSNEETKELILHAPRIAQVLQEEAEDVEEEEEGEDEDSKPAASPIPTPPPRKQTVKADPPTLPEWAPPVPQFKPDGPVARKKIDGEEKLVQTGTSPLTPAQLGDSWETEKTTPFMRTRNNLTVNGKITVRVTLRDFYEPKEEVHLEAVRGPKDKVTQVTIYSPLPRSAGVNK